MGGYGGGSSRGYVPAGYGGGSSRGFVPAGFEDEDNEDLNGRETSEYSAVDFKPTETIAVQETTVKTSDISLSGSQAKREEENSGLPAGAPAPPPLPYPKGSKWNIYVLQVVAMNKVLTMFDSYEDAFLDQTERMNTVYADNVWRSVRSVSPGSFYCAKVGSMRVRVKAVTVEAGSSSAACDLVDLGIQQTFSFSELSVLREEFCSLPVQVLPALLAGVDPGAQDNDEGLDVVRELVEGGSFTAIIANRMSIGTNSDSANSTLPKIVLIDKNNDNVSKKVIDSLKLR